MDVRRHPNSLAVLEQVPVNGTQQWILIRSESTTNPIVLFVHGGPGTSWLTPMRKNTQPLEKYFTVVNWDQRRAGKSFAAGRVDAEMTIGTFVDDIIALYSDLARRFHKNKILLVGHSWGSVVGVIAASRRPDLFSAYIGIGQMSRMAESELISYQWTLEQALRCQQAAHACAHARRTRDRDKDQQPDPAAQHVVFLEQLTPRIPEQEVSGQEFESKCQSHPEPSDGPRITARPWVNPTDR